MFDVGQAECFLLEIEGKNILIDCGDLKGSGKIVQALNEKSIAKIDYVFITHPHEDHMGGMYDIITKFPIGKIILPCIDYKMQKAKWFQQLIKEIQNGNYQVETAKLKATYNLDDLEIKVISDG